MADTKIVITQQDISDLMNIISPMVLKIGERFDCRASEAREAIRQTLNHVWPNGFSPIDVEFTLPEKVG